MEGERKFVILLFFMLAVFMVIASSLKAETIELFPRTKELKWKLKLGQI